MNEHDENEDEFVTCVGPLAVDWPRTFGYFAGIGGAVAFGLIAPELALLIAAVPLVKLLRRKNAPMLERVVGAVIEGAAKPVGGDAESCVRTRDAQIEKTKKRERRATQLTKDTTPAVDAESYFSTANGA